MTIAEYEERGAAQGGLCAICSRPPADGILRVDHDHSSGAVRGLLCDLCNRALGLLKDDVEVLEAAAAYLRAAA